MGVTLKYFQLLQMQKLVLLPILKKQNVLPFIFETSTGNLSPCFSAGTRTLRNSLILGRTVEMSKTLDFHKRLYLMLMFNYHLLGHMLGTLMVLVSRGCMFMYVQEIHSTHEFRATHALGVNAECLLCAKHSEGYSKWNDQSRSQ